MEPTPAQNPPPARAAWVRPAPHEWLLAAIGFGLLLAYYWLLDDAFIYYRYVDNYVFLHLGLVYNYGEYVEGYTSPLWLILLITLRTFHLAYPAIVIGTGFATYAAFCYALVVLNRALASPQCVLNLPLAFFATNYAVLCYFSSGLETPLVQLMAVLFAIAALRPAARGLHPVIALAPLLRYELVLPLLLLIVWIWAHNRRAPWRLLFVALLANGGWLLFRVWYYASLFPNVYYLKSGTDFAQGWIYFLNAVQPYHYLPITALMLLLALITRQHLSYRLFLLLMAFPVAFYVIKIGGDARHYRYLAFPLILLACSWAGLPEHALAMWSHPDRFRIAPWLAALVAIGLYTCYPPQLSGHPLVRHTVHVETDTKIADAFGHRWNYRLSQAFWGETARPENLMALREERPDWYYDKVHEEGWCVEAYVKNTHRIIHLLGLTDPYLARVPMFTDRPGHKYGLMPLALDLVRLQYHAAIVGPGFFERVANTPGCPKWVLDNLDTLNIIEARTYNEHNLFDNLHLALTPTQPILYESDPVSIAPEP